MDAVALGPRTDLNVADAMTLATDFFSNGMFAEAERLFKAAATAGGGYHAINGLAMALNELSRPAEALPLFDQAYAVLRTDMMALMANRAKSLMDLGRSEEALEIYDGIAQSNPRVLLVRYSRGLALLQMARHREAIEEFDFVLANDPEHDLARFGRGFANLVLGNYTQGFKDYEYRLKDTIEAPGVPLWTGAESLNGKTILIHGEQGHGDDIMFMRYVPLMVERGAHVLLVLHPGVRPLFEGMPGTTCFSEDRATWPKFDYWVRMMSLAGCFGTTVDTVPPPAPIELHPAHVNRFRDIVRNLDEGGCSFRVGLCWSGSPQSRYDSHRSLPLSEMAPLFRLEGVQFYSLQLGIRDRDRATFDGLFIGDLAPHLDNFADTAAAMACLDHIVTVDTSVAHLAGTVGVPTTVMLTAFRTYWLWLKDRELTPWYPSAHCIRQTTDGDWAPVIERVKNKLARRI